MEKSITGTCNEMFRSSDIRNFFGNSAPAVAILLISFSTVSLNHEDAWLFFDNIKPSVVIDKFASNILINGEYLQVCVNGRVAIYAHGIVIMPHTSTFKPLTLLGFNEPDHTGQANMTFQQMIETNKESMKN